jgi:hypothetical protein
VPVLDGQAQALALGGLGEIVEVGEEAALHFDAAVRVALDGVVDVEAVARGRAGVLGGCLSVPDAA